MGVWNVQQVARLLSTKLFPPPKRVGSSSGSNGITRPSTEAGSTSPNPNSACSPPSVSTGESRTSKRSSIRLAPGRSSATQQKPGLMGALRGAAAAPPRTKPRLSDHMRGLRYLYNTGACRRRCVEARSEIVRSQTSCPPETVGSQSPKGHQRSQGVGSPEAKTPATSLRGAGTARVNRRLRPPGALITAALPSVPELARRRYCSARRRRRRGQGKRS